MPDTTTPREDARTALQGLELAMTGQRWKPTRGAVREILDIAHAALDREEQVERASGHLDDLIRIKETLIERMQAQRQQANRDLAGF